MGSFRPWAILSLFGAAVLAVPASADTLVTCDSAFAMCLIPENQFLQFPAGFLGFAGDVVVVDASGGVSDVFRIFNDVFDTGNGTGLGTTAFLYSVDDSTPLPAPSSYSANVQFIKEAPSGITDYTNNGTTYVLAAPEPSAASLIVLGGLILLAVRLRAWRSHAGSIVLLAVFCVPGFSQEPLPAEALDSLQLIFDLPPAPGPAQNPRGAGTSAQAAGLQFYTANYESLGRRPIPFNIIGTDPAKGAATTSVTTVMVPLKLVFESANGLSLDATNAAILAAQSPVFSSAPYATGGTNVGTTQYGDAMLRAQYWNLPGFSQGYHVLLAGPVILPTITVQVPASLGDVYVSSTGGLLGVVSLSYLNAIVRTFLPAFAPSLLPVFLTHNVVGSDDGTRLHGCCVGGFHGSQGPPIQTATTWIFASYTEPGFFAPASSDVFGLSHEVAEWLNDPFPGAGIPGGLNLVPPAVLPGQGGACIFYFEDADPLESPPVALTKTTNGITYHLTDVVFLSWYLHNNPSFSVNGYYTFLNTFPTFSTLCGPG